MIKSLFCAYFKCTQIIIEDSKEFIYFFISYFATAMSTLGLNG